MLAKNKQFNIGKWKARFLVRLIGSIEEGDYVTDQGSWDLVVNYDDNKNKKVSGALIGNEGGSSYGGKHV